MAERLNPSELTAYERPELPFRCGRAGNWHRPCWQGPGLDGSCGGTAACAPARKGDRWECRRPAVAGGPCGSGPLPDGGCAHRRPACVPRPSLRRLRGRLTLLAALLAIAVLASLADFAPSPASFNAINPGPISEVHAGFTGEAGCTACHAAHGLDSWSWLKASLTLGGQPEQCLACHRFAGPEQAAHNTAFPSERGLAWPSCAGCHTEHRGEKFRVSRIDDVLCENCHEPKVSHFNRDHPPFGTEYPYQIPNNIEFNHEKHLGEYFDPESRYMRQSSRDPDFAARAKAACTTCHAVETASREVSPKPFETICAGCHTEQILERPLVVHIPGEVTPLVALLLGLDPDGDEDAALEKVRGFLATLADGGVDALGEALTERTGVKDPRALIEGLSGVLLRAASNAWKVEDGEFDGPEVGALETGGWRAGWDDDGNQSLRYAPRRHADVVLRAWIRLARGLRASSDAELAAAATRALEYLLDPSDGAGSCGKCHRAGLTYAERSAGAPDWQFTGPSDRPHTYYAHAPHINILGANASCRNCHILNPEADYAAYFAAPRTEKYVSNFHSIQKSTCEKCHAEGGVTVSCQTCHRYHRGPGFKADFQIRDGIRRDPRRVERTEPAEPPKAS